MIERGGRCHGRFCRQDLIDAQILYLGMQWLMPGTVKGLAKIPAEILSDQFRPANGTLALPVYLPVSPQFKLLFPVIEIPAVVANAPGESGPVLTRNAR